jgi:peptidoglycan/LPS O-acetylase OafA/YrhL
MNTYLRRIDSLRGVAIILVVIYHVGILVFDNYKIRKFLTFFADFDQYNQEQIILNATPFSLGFLGVHIFLIISGFLIHYNYLLNQKTFKWPRFFNKRFWRIYPPYLVALILFSFVSNPDWENFVLHGLLAHNLDKDLYFSINASFWSLALEMQLYMIYPAYLWLYNKFGPHGSLGLVAGLSLSLATIGMIFGITDKAYLTSVFNFWIVWVLGAYVADRYYHKKSIAHLNLLQLIVLLLPLIMLRYTVVYAYFYVYLFSAYFVLVMEWLLRTEFKKTAGTKFLNKVLPVTGLYSYSIYLFHQPVFQALIPRLKSINDSYLFLLAVATVIYLGIFIFSYFSYRLLEQPSVKLGQWFYDKYLKPKTVKPAVPSY